MGKEEVKRKCWILFLILVISLLAIVAVGFKADKAIAWPIIFGTMIIMFMTIGWSVSINNRFMGVLINERNSMSLSRFQMVLWSLIILSAYAAIALIRARSGQGVDAMEVTVPTELWMLMGINSASLVGSPMLSSNKTKKRPINTNLSEINDMGILSVKKDENDASITDLFRGDEVNNWNYVDMPRLQMFFFTIVVAIVYCVEVYQIVNGENVSSTVALPTIDEGMITLMGISNAAYLGGKAVDQTPATQK